MQAADSAIYIVVPETFTYGLVDELPSRPPAISLSGTMADVEAAAIGNKMFSVSDGKDEIFISSKRI